MSENEKVSIKKMLKRFMYYGYEVTIRPSLTGSGYFASAKPIQGLKIYGSGTTMKKALLSAYNAMLKLEGEK